jgi:hypothetical protein
MTHSDDARSPAQRFADEADRRRRGTWGELVDFLRSNKRWWLAPIVIVLLLLGVLLVLGGTALAPLIYPLI